MSILEVKDLCKNYPQFSLKNVSFSLEQGKITGFIGRNGAGKTTTLKSIFGLIHPDGGSVRFFDKDFAHDEADIKQKTALVSGGIDHYLHKKLKSITAVSACFTRGGATPITICTCASSACRRIRPRRSFRLE